MSLYLYQNSNFKLKFILLEFSSKLLLEPQKPNLNPINNFF